MKLKKDNENKKRIKLLNAFLLSFFLKYKYKQSKKPCMAPKRTIIAIIFSIQQCFKTINPITQICNPYY